MTSLLRCELAAATSQPRRARRIDIMIPTCRDHRRLGPGGSSVRLRRRQAASWPDPAAGLVLAYETVRGLAGPTLGKVLLGARVALLVNGPPPDRTQSPCRALVPVAALSIPLSFGLGLYLRVPLGLVQPHPPRPPRRRRRHRRRPLPLSPAAPRKLRRSRSDAALGIYAGSSGGAGATRAGSRLGEGIHSASGSLITECHVNRRMSHPSRRARSGGRRPSGAGSTCRGRRRRRTRRPGVAPAMRDRGRRGCRAAPRCAGAGREARLADQPTDFSSKSLPVGTCAPTRSSTSGRREPDASLPGRA